MTPRPQSEPQPEPAARALRDDEIETTRALRPSAARAVLLREGGPLRRDGDPSPHRD